MYGERSTPALNVRVDGGRTVRFAHPFHVGRSAECDLQVDDYHVSRKHLLISITNGRWTFTDLQSANGVFVNGTRAGNGVIADGMTLRLGGEDGPALVVRLEEPAAPVKRVEQHVPEPVEGETRMIASLEQRYFGEGGDDDEPAGPRTMMIRKAFKQVQKRQQRRYRYVLAGLAIVALAASAFAIHFKLRNRALEAQAAELFYTLREIDLRAARTDLALEASGKRIDSAEARERSEKRRVAQANYEKFLETTGVYGRKLTDEEKLILKVMRIFGESELIVPHEYIREVQGYIQGWRSTKRFSRDIGIAKERGYVRRIVEEFSRQNLPPQFLYLAMQESDFNPFAVGPPTRFGLAKGMWQFIPGTGSDYGLKIGPLKAARTYDAGDERMKWDKATVAAAKYIKTIYSTDAQASGLLVMASYNWGERRVVNLIKSLPDNPRDRNFWLLLRDHREKVPDETYKYVFSIVSAAVIGENPRLFGFDFDNPIAEVLQAQRGNVAPVTGRDVPQVLTASR
ncbi:Membrane-bound lytic murein transglycosylase D precursor [Luteitalea pratensis]|uniref:Membrane-bound lytic murein transglycosylase D n=1 Tax=Luteitalea pratensis TaxID=1855912 RepID=A0A143PHT0_LUTPR|nr:FHA domain-containing protein [Luteitalea pratensis]AMY08142.1 Membrane-bound lytic murein transglycosylase D precursor [Luteitalea pratensis]